MSSKHINDVKSNEFRQSKQKKDTGILLLNGGKVGIEKKHKISIHFM